MEYITKERFEQNIKSAQDKLTEEQKKRMTKAVFENEEILRQLGQSELDPEENDITDPHEFAKLLR